MRLQCLHIKNTEHSISYISELLEKIPPPSIIISPSGFLSTINKNCRVITRPRVCIHVKMHTSLTQTIALS